MSSPDVAKYGPWALVLGGSEGVGREFATQLADAGYDLVLVARKPEPLEETAQLVRDAGRQVRTLAADLTDASSWQQIMDLTADLEVGLLIFNAGANSYGHEFVTSDMAKLQQLIDLNITSQLHLTQHYGAKMKERGKGGIILIGSLAGYLGSANISVYGAVKAFSRIWAEGLWLELREHGVDVLHYVLGTTRTPAMERAGLKMDIPGMAVGEPADVARQGLSLLTEGPVQIAGGEQNQKSAAARSAEMDRAKLALATQEFMKKLLPER